MNDDIATLDFALVFQQFDALFKVDSETRQKLRECTPLPWDSTQRHGEEV